MAAVRSRSRPPASSQAGFTLVEMLISLVLLLFALGLASQILIESQQALVDTAAEALDSPVPLAVARLRSDVLTSSSFAIAVDEVLGHRLALVGHPEGTVLYEREGTDLVRRVYDGLGIESGRGLVLRGVTDFQAFDVVEGFDLLRIDIGYSVHQGRKSPLPTVPGFRGPRTKDQKEVLFLLPRGRP